MLVTVVPLLVLPLGRPANGQVARPLRPVEGSLSVESLVQVDPDWTVVFRRELERRSVAISDLVSWGALRDRDSGTHVVLACGSILVGDVTALGRDFVTVRGRLWPDVRLPRRHVRGIVMRPPLDSLERDLLFKRVQSGVRTDDQLLLDNRDRMSGRLAAELDAGPDQPRIETIPWIVAGTTQTVPIPSARLVAILISSTGPAPQRDAGNAPAATTQPRILVGFSDGSRLIAERMTRERDALLVDLPDDLQLRCERTLPAPEGPWQDIVMLQSLTGKATYLSDLVPLGHKQVPLFELTWPFSRDANVAGGQLRHKGHVFHKGIGMHSTSRLAYELSETFRWLDAELAIDERAGRQGSVVFRVYVQAAGGPWSKAYESPVVRGGQPRVAMHVDLRGAVRVALIVDAADRLQVWDHANWLNARLIK
jgi:hypothetical protein